MNYSNRFSSFTKVLAVTLSLLIILLGLPLSVFAEDLQALFVDETDGNSAPAIDVTAEASEHSFEPFEETSLRSESTKTFRLSDGSHYLAQYTTDIHNLDADGNYQDIDNTLKLAAGVFSTEDGRFSLAEKTGNGKRLLTRSFGTASLSFSLKNALPAVGTVEKSAVELPEDASAIDRLTTLPNITSAVLYENVMESTDLKYVISGNDVREYIVIHAPAEQYAYSFEITVQGLSAETGKDGGIVFNDAETGDFVCRIPAPVMWDAQRNVPEKINSVITENSGEDGETVLLVTYTADADWMNAPERKYPVTLDPPVIANRSTGVTDLDVKRSNPTYNGSVSTSLYVSSDWRAYWKTNTLPTLPLLARITDATIALETIDDGGEGYLGVFDVLTDWDSTLTWGKVANATNPQGKPADSCTDYVRVQEDVVRENASDSSGRIIFHIPAIVDKWYNGENHGLMLMPAQNNSFSDTVHLRSSECGTVVSRPALTVTYLDMKGTEDHWSFTSQSAGQAGTGYINNATGNLVFSIPTLSTTDSLLPVTPTLVYNYNMNFADSCYPNVQSANRYSHTAKSFRLNLNETVIEKAFTNLSGGTTYYYIWTDGDGTEHYFLSQGDGTYADEDGLLLTLRDESDTVTITDSGRNVRTFHDCTSPNGVVGAWYLSSVTDRYGNRVQFTVDNSAQSNRITEIWLYPNGGSGILQMRLLYNNAGKLC